ncbi:MAG: biotin--[acetyl-CoA-carboxylase] ligase [Gallionella sp.]|nr:biotin--[acetyl-CoA-carboxylase] ligase [Gallionella sp.]OIO10147.1 MAG: biotin--[acetyl-CoA-carboxylase] ligase [Gallionellaceae bacterium CG1_02_60_325]PIV47948.1 MAG: biotin--[acetyl-CoA-carboxylase] ligase [Gallionellaceae bacterium CG02_land_8_20_14_3_00_60_115]PIY06532.1 MAG: biotin--[acetyl-CoA-carboxylase] ligase [Gallionellaceae bacterium CG_4_10_14_3_um_filter_60_1069]PJC04911.1 MAG: biotin--[acetyl-CoA-carboxylase] ligase [Gallionellaceae bacterium CG_4_9_14_0_8_um_filter_60_335]
MKRAAQETPLTFALLRLLADGAFHSGQTMAAQLGTSRASVHNALREVGMYGLDLHRVRGRGYRLAHPLHWLDEALIKQQLDAGTVVRLEIVEHTSSTNAMLLQRAVLGAASGSVLAAEWQSAGRGRLGRAWQAGLGDALTFSLLWRFDGGLGGLSGLSLAVGVAVLRALDEIGVREAGLKWPNDVLLGAGKLAGILLEAQGDMLGPSAVVIGVGLNLRVPATARAVIDQPVSDLVTAGVAAEARSRVFGILLKHLLRVMEEFSARGFAALREEWEAHHAFRQREVKLSLPDGTSMVGWVCGVTDEGALRVQTATGERVFHAGEISLRGM